MMGRIFLFLLGFLVAAMAGYIGYRFRVRHLKTREKELGSRIEVCTTDLNERNIEVQNAREQIQGKNQQLETQSIQLKEQSEKLTEMDKIKARFFDNISHEFRTPLTLIMGPLEQMMEECPENEEETKRKLSLMFRNTQRLLRMINQLLELSKLETGSLKIHARETGIVSFVKKMTESFQLVARKQKLDLLFHEPQAKHDPDRDTENKDISIYIDRQRMEDILSNLLANAIKFTPAGGEVTVTVTGVSNSQAEESFPEGWVEISVSDTGPGIPAAQLPQLFDRFYQAESTYEHHEKGTGIGLALCKELVELHHGTIRVENPKSGGTEFIIRLPVGSAHLSPEDIPASGLPRDKRAGSAHRRVSEEIHS
ncbi:MAG: HAMP domain-containing histidine kinase [bacterium]|nr:HAMP domain-containing histidine kinase [bacterium]